MSDMDLKKLARRYLTQRAKTGPLMCLINYDLTAKKIVASVKACTRDTAICVMDGLFKGDTLNDSAIPTSLQDEIAWAMFKIELGDGVALGAKMIHILNTGVELTGAPVEQVFAMFRAAAIARMDEDMATLAVKSA